MKNLIIRARIIFFTMIIISLFVTLYGIYMPMKTEIERNLIENFHLLSESKADILTSIIEKNLQGSRSLSSRTMIKNKIVEYKNGSVDFEELKAFTDDKFSDGAKVLENLMYARRIVDDTVVSELCIENCINCLNVQLYPAKEISYSLFIKDNIICMEVISPIMENEDILGYDVLGFCLNNIVDSLNKDDIKFDVCERKETIKSLDNFSNIFEDDEFIYYIAPLYKENEIVISKSKDMLFKSLDDIVSKSSIYIAIGYVSMLLLVYGFIINYAKRQIRNLSENLDIYKTHADMDSLTGAYSRLYFNEFIEKYPYRSGFLVLIDLDSFKNINDKFGHIIGDSVLKTVVYVIKKSIKTEDIIIRYGGDEFILILENKDHKDTENIIKKIQFDLKKITEFNFLIDFSYGISFVEEMKDAYINVKEADERMYECKRKKQK